MSLPSGEIIIWAMNANPFLSSLIRIQNERGHYVVSGGPYRFVRHPSYAGAILYVVCSALALGSWPSILPVRCASGSCLASGKENRLLERMWI